MHNPRWIQSAIENKGSLTREAHREGYNCPICFAEHVVRNPDQYNKITKERANLALTLNHLHKHHH